MHYHLHLYRDYIKMVLCVAIIYFCQPRPILKNNLIQSTYRLDVVSEDTIALRAQQMSMDDLIDLWNTLLPLPKDQ